MDPRQPATRTGIRWGWRAFAISVSIVVAVGLVARAALGLLAPLLASVGLSGAANFVTAAVPMLLAFVAALMMNILAADAESRGAGLGAWVGLALFVAITRALSIAAA